MDRKSIFLSKTFWVGLLAAVAPVIHPAVNQYISENPADFSALVGVSMVLLRLLSSKGVSVI